MEKFDVEWFDHILKKDYSKKDVLYFLNKLKQALISEFIRYLVRCKHDANWTIDDTIKEYEEKLK